MWCAVCGVRSLVPRVSILPNPLLYKEYLEFHPFAFKELLSIWVVSNLRHPCVRWVSIR